MSQLENEVYKIVSMDLTDGFLTIVYYADGKLIYLQRSVLDFIGDYHGMRAVQDITEIIKPISDFWSGFELVK